MSEKVIDQGGVEITIDERGVATIEFHHPLSNSLPAKVLRKLALTIEGAGKDERVKVILLKSTSSEKIGRL